MTTEATTCLHCGRNAVEAVLRYRTLATFRCRACGGFFNNPGQVIGQIYDHAFYARNYLPRERQQLELSRAYVREIREFVKNGSVLDYGCGTAIFLRAAAEGGFERNVGADVSAEALRLAAERAVNDVEWVHLPVQELPDRKFEVVALMDSITQIPRPRELVQKLTDHHLAEGGVLVIRTPHIPPSYLRLVLLLSKMLGRQIGASCTFAGSRYALFDEISIRRFLDQFGLKILVFHKVADYYVRTPHRPLVIRLRKLIARTLQWGIKSMFIIAKRER